MQGFSWQPLKNTLLIILVIVAAGGWLYVAYNGHRANDPTEIVKKHFVFYPEYSHGIWREANCASVNVEKCREVTYTVPVKGCGTVTFTWRVFPDRDAATNWSYNGSSPKFDDTKYAFYAVLSEDSRLIDSPALGKPAPETCPLN
jgi:hypothetical protein